MAFASFASSDRLANGFHRHRQHHHYHNHPKVHLLQRPTAPGIPLGGTTTLLTAQSPFTTAATAVATAAMTTSHTASSAGMEEVVLSSSLSLSLPPHYDAVLPDPFILWSMSVVTILCVLVAVFWSQQVVPITRSKLALSKRSGTVRQYLDQLQKENYDNSMTMMDHHQGDLLHQQHAVVHSYNDDDDDDDDRGDQVVTPQQTAVAPLAITTLSEMSTATTRDDRLLTNNQSSLNVILTSTNNDTVTTATSTSSSQLSPSELLLAQNSNDNNDNNNSMKQNKRNFERWLFADWLRQQKRPRPANLKRRKEPALPVLKSAVWNSGDNPVLMATALIMTPVLLTSIIDYFRHYYY